MAAEVSLELFDVSGRRVDTILDRRHLEPGAHQAYVTARNRPSGIYLARLRARVDGQDLVKVVKIQMIR